MDNKSLSHSKYNCCYHVVFVPKYRRKAMYGEVRKDLVDIFKQLCQMKHVDLVDGAICKDHVHMYLSIPPKISISSFMSHLKGKSALMLFDRHPEYKEKNNKHFWARGFYSCLYRYRHKATYADKIIMPINNDNVFINGRFLIDLSA